MNEVEIKQIVSSFINKNPDEIDETSKITLGSVLTTRFYSELKKKGYWLRNGDYPKTYGELKNSLISSNTELVTSEGKNISIEHKSLGSNTMIGIDIESISNFKYVPDFRMDVFYKDVFSDREISYCIIQNDPVESFAGKYAAKEAVKKTDYNLARLPMNQIEILNTNERKPFYKGYDISISHSNGFAIAVALKNGVAVSKESSDGILDTNEQSNAVSRKMFLSIKKVRKYLVLHSFIMFLIILELLLHIFRI